VNSFLPPKIEYKLATERSESKLFDFSFLVRRAGFEPAKAGPADLQSALVDRLSTDASYSEIYRVRTE
jgi:hypothetical protein